jgi:hypothetical protein
MDFRMQGATINLYARLNIKQGKMMKISASCMSGDIMQKMYKKFCFKTAFFWNVRFCTWLKFPLRLTQQDPLKQ